MLDISVEEAEKLIDEGNDRELMEGALQTGDLQVTIHNDFADPTQEIDSGSFYDNTGIRNFEAAVDHMLDREDKIELLLGKRQVAIDFRIERLDRAVPAETLKFFTGNKMPAMQIGQYFEVTLTKTSQNESRQITELPEELELVLHLPDQLKADNRKFYILNMHTGADGRPEYTEFADKDKDADTVTFSADRFSTCAIAYIDWQPKAEQTPEITDTAADSDAPEGNTVTAGNPGMNNTLTSIAVVLVVILVAAVCILVMLLIMRKRRE